MDQNYKGIANLGATCYMNSLLQTLFMTPEFREAVYNWKYNERVHPQKQKSILYQIQKLFGKLDKFYPGQISTKDLVKSFDWEDEDAQMQQDIQQFNRVLFEALEKSLISKKKIETNNRNHFVRQLYQGEMVHYTLCKECQNQSQREETFQDIMITVKNQYEKVYNASLDLGLQRYMKPEILDKDNMYNCEACEKKVQAQRGVRFLKLPKLLNIILRRFDFDYFTFQRIKINDRVEFPHILNFNRYMQGYDQIPEKLNQDTAAYFKTQPPKKINFPTSNTTNAKRVTKKPVVTNVAGKKTTKPSANTKSFLQEMRKKKMMSQQENDDLIYINGSSSIQSSTSSVNTDKVPGSIPEEVSQKEIKSEEYKVQSDESSPMKKDKPKSQVTDSTQQLSKNQDKVKETDSKLENQTKPNIPLPPPLDLPIPQLSESYCPTNKNSNEPSMTIQQELRQKVEEKQRLQKQKEQKLKELQEKNHAKITEYLKEGPLVYELYSVLVHNGSANHGHYFSYIKSFENQNWYCFNDERVSIVNVEEIEQSFGGAGSSNAYALYYRLVESQNYRIETRPMMPQYIDALVQEQIQRFQKRQHEKIENLENLLILKIHYMLYVKQLQIHKGSTLKLCLQKAREMFDIKQENVSFDNSRLRIYNPVSDTMFETFTGREDKTLQQLGIGSFKSMIIETKKSQDVFEQFIAGKINIRIVLWEINGENLQSLDEAHLKVFKVPVIKNSKMIDVEKEIIKKRNESLVENGLSAGSQNICIIKRHQNDEYSYHQIINMADYKEKTLDELMVIDNEILFIQEDSNDLKWPQQFENEVHRINVRYNNLITGKTQSLLTDSRKTLGELKKNLCQIINEDPEDIIMRSGSSKSGLQLKILSMTMKDAKFIPGKMLHLEKGIPAKQGEVRIQLFFAFNAEKQLYNRLHEFQFIADVPISKEWKASQVKDLFVKIVKKYKDLDLSKDNFRIREKVCDKIGRIYREKPMKQQQLIQKRQIAIEMRPDTIELKENQIYIRLWNPEEWTLSEPKQILVTKTTSMIELGEIVLTIFPDISVENMEICRILSINKFNILDLCDMEYFALMDVSVISQPLFVNADGLLFIIKDKCKEPRQLTKQQQMKFGGQIKHYSIKSKRKPTSSYVPKKQKGVTIRVTENKEEEES